MELGVPELLVILLIALVFWGPGKLPQLGRSMGEAIREFKHSLAAQESAKPEDSAEAENDKNKKNEKK